jgi:hypothetical protein
MSVFKAEPVIIPSDLAERFDRGTGQEEGYLRNLIADKGGLHQLDEELLSIGLMSMVKGLMEDKNLPDEFKPLSIDRLSNVIYVIMFAYCTGTMRVDEDGDVSFGHSLEDVRKAIEVATSKKIKFANGRTMDTPEFMAKLRATSSPESIGKTYNKVVTRQVLTKGITPQSAFKVALVAIMASQDLMAGK